jgi:hypothetical protein
MPKLTVETVGSFEVPAGKRLVNALSDEAGIDQLLEATPAAPLAGSSSSPANPTK